MKRIFLSSGFLKILSCLGVLVILLFISLPLLGFAIRSASGQPSTPWVRPNQSLLMQVSILGSRKRLSLGREPLGSELKAERLRSFPPPQQSSHQDTRKSDEKTALLVRAKAVEKRRWSLDLQFYSAAATFVHDPDGDVAAFSEPA
jgi:hypothetical protein